MACSPLSSPLSAYELSSSCAHSSADINVSHSLPSSPSGSEHDTNEVSPQRGVLSVSNRRPRLPWRTRPNSCPSITRSQSCPESASKREYVAVLVSSPFKAPATRTPTSEDLRRHNSRFFIAPVGLEIRLQPADGQNDTHFIVPDGVTS